MSGLNQLLSRPGSGITLPTDAIIDPLGLLLYAKPAGGGYEFYEVPASRLINAKSGTATSGTQQIAKLTYTAGTTATTGGGTITVALVSAALGRTVTATTAAIAHTAAVAAIATAISTALNLVLTSDDDLLITVDATAGTVNVKGGAIADSTLALTVVSTTTTGTASNNSSPVAAVLGAVPDYLGQMSINNNTVQVATSLRNNTWTTVS